MAHDYDSWITREPENHCLHAQEFDDEDLICKACELYEDCKQE